MQRMVVLLCLFHFRLDFLPLFFSLTGIDFGEFVFPSFPPLIFFLCFASKISFHLRQLVLCERTFEIRHKYSIWMVWYGMGKWEHWKLSSFINHYLSDSCLRLWYVVWTIQRYKLQEQFLSPVYCGFCLVFSKKKQSFFLHLLQIFWIALVEYDQMQIATKVLQGFQSYK